MMKAMMVVSLLAAGVLAAPAAAQQHAHGAGQHENAHGVIKALTHEQVHGYLHGEGMGMATAAELNHYPGPKHALELAEALGLTAEQRTRVEAVRAKMLERATPIGGQIVELEKQLDALFAESRATTEAVEDLTTRVGTLNGQLRAVHLVAHLETKELLSPDQIRIYDAHRGHGGAGHGHDTP